MFDGKCKKIFIQVMVLNILSCWLWWSRRIYWIKVRRWWNDL